jgi:hypothetical protein
MYTKWTQHLKDKEEKEDFEKHVWSAKPVLDRLMQLLTNSIDGIEKSEISLKNYDLPNWDYRQADYNGYKRALMEIKTLIDLDQQRE